MTATAHKPKWVSVGNGLRSKTFIDTKLEQELRWFDEHGHIQQLPRGGVANVTLWQYSSDKYTSAYHDTPEGALNPHHRHKKAKREYTTQEMDVQLHAAGYSIAATKLLGVPEPDQSGAAPAAAAGHAGSHSHNYNYNSSSGHAITASTTELGATTTAGGGGSSSGNAILGGTATAGAAASGMQPELGGSSAFYCEVTVPRVDPARVVTTWWAGHDDKPGAAAASAPAPTAQEQPLAMFTDMTNLQQPQHHQNSMLKR